MNIKNLLRTSIIIFGIIGGIPLSTYGWYTLFIWLNTPNPIAWYAFIFEAILWAIFNCLLSVWALIGIIIIGKAIIDNDGGS